MSDLHDLIDAHEQKSKKYLEQIASLTEENEKLKAADFRMQNSLQSQCWICPNCHDDHSYGKCPMFEKQSQALEEAFTLIACVHHGFLNNTRCRITDEMMSEMENWLAKCPEKK